MSDPPYCRRKAKESVIVIAQPSNSPLNSFHAHTYRITTAQFSNNEGIIQDVTL